MSTAIGVPQTRQRPGVLIAGGDQFTLEVRTALTGWTRCVACHTTQAVLSGPGSGSADVAIVESGFPETPAVDLLGRLHGCRPDLPIIFCASSEAPYSLACEALSAGAAALLQMPLDSGVLVHALSWALYAPACLEPIESGVPDMWTSILAQVREGVPHGVRMKELLNQFGMSRSTFHRHFVATTGVTFRHYVTWQRVRLAMHLLASTRMRSSEVAARIGLDDPSYFPRWFRRHFGMSPTAFRRARRSAAPTVMRPPSTGGENYPLVAGERYTARPR